MKVKSFYKFDLNKLNQEKLSIASDTNINKSIIYVNPKSSNHQFEPTQNEKNESVSVFMKKDNKMSLTNLNNRLHNSIDFQNSMNSFGFRFNSINLRPAFELHKKAEICLIYNCY